MSYQIQIRRDSEANWNTNNPVLAAGEIAFSTDINKVKIGNGTSAWASLTYLAASGSGDVATDAIWDAKGDLAGGTGANTAARLPIGTNDQVLTADSTQSTGMKWATPKNISNDATWAAKGDLIVATANDTAQVLSVGANNTALIADSAQTTGTKWAAIVNSVTGTPNEVTVSSSTGSVTIGLPDSITVVDLNTDQVDFNITPASTTMAQGRVLWDATDKTLMLGLNANVNAKVSQNLYKYVHNSTGGTINKGEVVYIDGSHASTSLLVAKARADSEATSADTIGVAAESISNGSDGFVIVFGLLTGITTNAITGSPAEGDPLYLSEATAGAVRAGLPTAPNHGVRVGFLVKSAGSGAGSIFVNVQNYQELEELSDVYITGEATNDFLVYDTNRWVNKTAANSRTALGLGTVATESVVPLNKGGTGQTSASEAFEALAPSTTAGDIIYYNGANHVRLGIGTANQLLRVNTGATAPEWATVSTGGISDGDKGDITVSASGATWTIDNDAVTYAKIQNVSATDKLLGRSTAGAGDIEEIDCTSAGRALIDDVDASAQRTTLGLGTVATESTVPINKGGTGQTTQTAAFDALAPTTTAGDIIYYNGTDNIRLGIGTAGQVLKVNSGATAPEWGSGGSGAPTDAQYVTLATNTTLTNERVLTVGDHITLNDGGAGGNATIDWLYDPRKDIFLFNECHATDNMTASNANGGSAGFTDGSAASSEALGVVRTRSGATTNGRSHFGSSTTDQILFGTRAHKFEVKTKYSNLSNATDRYETFIGFYDAFATGSMVDGAWFQYRDDINSGKFECITSSNSTATTTDSGITVATTDYYKFTILVNSAGTEVIFKIDDTTVATHTTNIPTGSGRNTGFGVCLRKTAAGAGTADRFITTDYINLEITGQNR